VEVTVHPVCRPIHHFVRNGCLQPTAADYTTKAKLSHQPGNGAARHRDLLTIQLTPHLADTVDPEVLVPDPLDLRAQPCVALDVTRAVVNAVDIPVTVKIRLGWDDDHLVTRTLPPLLADTGIAAITVHGRTTAQKFRDHVRLEGIADVVEAVKAKHPHVAVIGNGDVKTPQDARRMLEVTGCDGVMIGRGALGQPWLFRNTAHYLATGQLLEPLPRAERARIVLRHFETMLEWRQDERRAVNMIRTRISWYSLHLQPWPGLRREVHVMRTANEFRDYMFAGIERIEAEEGEVERQTSNVERPGAGILSLADV